jgi:ATP-dependent helicase/nuclease subunit B
MDHSALPPWEVELGEGHRLHFIGAIDRVDLWVDRERDEALCLVLDYKSSAHQIDPLLLAHGIQLQLPAYLGMLGRLADPRPSFGVGRLVPCGFFYVSLRGRYSPGVSREAVLGQIDQSRRMAYQHLGRFDAAVLRKLDRRQDADAGDQFNYQLKRDGTPHKRCREIMASDEFLRMLDTVENHLRRMGREIFGGKATVDPYRKGTDTACARCEYRAICRIDPWTHKYRVLNSPDD